MAKTYGFKNTCIRVSECKFETSRPSVEERRKDLVIGERIKLCMAFHV